MARSRHRPQSLSHLSSSTDCTISPVVFYLVSQRIRVPWRGADEEGEERRGSGALAGEEPGLMEPEVHTLGN